MTLGTELLAKSATPATATPVCDTSGRSVKAADSTRADVTDDKTCPTPAGMTSPSPRPAISFKAQQFANAPRAGPRNCPEGPCSRTCPRGEIRANRRARRPVATGMSARRVDTMFSSPDGSATVISINFVHGRRSRPPGARSSLLLFFSTGTFDSTGRRRSIHIVGYHGACLGWAVGAAGGRWGRRPSQSKRLKRRFAHLSFSGPC